MNNLPLIAIVTGLVGLPVVGYLLGIEAERGRPETGTLAQRRRAVRAEQSLRNIYDRLATASGNADVALVPVLTFQPPTTRLNRHGGHDTIPAASTGGGQVIHFPTSPDEGARQ